MYHRMVQEPQPNPLLPGYTFNAYLVAGLTPILADGPLDFFIDRPGGMKGYILNLTIKGQGKIFDGENTFYSNPGDLLLFPPKHRTIMVVHRTVTAGITAGSTSGHGLTGLTGWSGTVKPMKWGAYPYPTITCCWSLTACLPISNRRKSRVGVLVKSWA